MRWGIDGSQDVWVEEKGRRVKKWVRVASPLIALSDGTWVTALLVERNGVCAAEPFSRARCTSRP